MANKRDVHLLFILDNVEKNYNVRRGISECLEYFNQKQEPITIAHQIMKIDGKFYIMDGEIDGFTGSINTIIGTMANSHINIKGITLVLVSGCVSVNPDYLIHKGIFTREPLLYQGPLELLNVMMKGIKHKDTPYHTLTILFPCALSVDHAAIYKPKLHDEEEIYVNNNTLYRMNYTDDEGIASMMNFIKTAIEDFRKQNQLSK